MHYCCCIEPSLLHCLLCNIEFCMKCYPQYGIQYYKLLDLKLLDRHLCILCDKIALLPYHLRRYVCDPQYTILYFSSYAQHIIDYMFLPNNIYNLHHVLKKGFYKRKCQYPTYRYLIVIKNDIDDHLPIRKIRFIL